MLIKSLFNIVGFLILVTGCKTGGPDSNTSELNTATSVAGLTACSKIKGAGSGDFEFSSICLSETEATATTGTFEGSSYKYKVSKSKEMTGAYELAPEKSPSGEIGSPLLVILKVKKDYKVTSLVEALIAKGITMPGGGGRIWIIGQPSPQATQGGSVIADDFHLDTSASNSSTPNSNPSAPHSNPASKPVSPPISTSKPGRFACGSIKGAGSGDFEFKSICLSETEATATTGTFEGSSYKYKVSKSKEMTGAYELAPEKSPSGEVGKPLLVILKIKKEYKVTSLVDALLAKDITVPGGGGRIWVVGHPHTNQNETFIADDFQLSQ